MSSSPRAIPPHCDTYIVSDLHLAEGWLVREQRYSRLETFFYDLEFRNFTREIITESAERQRTAALVLNGDIFDFLAIVRTPEGHATIKPTRIETEFGLGTTEAHAVWKMERIVLGHPRFFEGLAELLCAGHYLAFIRGNHDLELHWPGVQQVIRAAVLDAATSRGLVREGDSPSDRVSFHMWFLYEPGRYWIEHGNQYERSNAVQSVLNPILPPEYHEHGEIQLDYPIGSIFMRFVYNKMRLLDPYTTHFVTLDQYLSITYHHNFVDLLRAGTMHFPLFTRAVQQARVFEQQGMAPVQAEHERKVEALSRESGLGDALPAILKLQSRAMGTTKYNLLRQMLRPITRAALSFVAVSLLTLFTWFALFTWIQETPWLSQGLLGKASLLAVLAVVTVVGLFFGFSFLNRALHRSAEDAEPYDREVAAKIAALAGVPFVSMGHSHMVDLVRFTDREGAFANSGTWCPHPGPWDSIRPKARQFTFVRIIDDEIAIRRWNEAAKKWEPVALLEEYRPSTFERLLADDKTGEYLHDD